jgi:hypothetical protein
LKGGQYVLGRANLIACLGALIRLLQVHHRPSNPPAVLILRLHTIRK